MAGSVVFDSGRMARMADISITQQHQLSQEAARAAAQKVADKLAGEYGLQCRWDGDVLRFERSGVEGTLALGERQAALRIKLGMLMGAFRSTIEAKVAESMRKGMLSLSGLRSGRRTAAWRRPARCPSGPPRRRTWRGRSCR
jgi:putative polyhydroxyalkanoate system protein